ncbi:hypothetical protein, partial [Streptomyces calidiresistens]|uniref:hypothetical protein n=1 Tax=Streptomyces calidiresistens TaxID=1485586 RepID=UPI0015FC076D
PSLGLAPDLSLLLALGVPTGACLLGLTGWATLRRARRPRKRSGNPAVKVAALAALACTAYSADTSWRFAANHLDMAGTAERAAMFAAAELALFATALMARQNLVTQGAPGVPGTLIWVITAVQVIPAYAESGPVGGTVRAFVGPVMAAMLWHLAMGLEVRLRSPEAGSRGLIATLAREARERLLSRLGLAARDRDAAQITRDRATARAVALAAALAEMTPQQQRNRRGRRLTRRLSKALGKASVGTDPVRRAELLDQLAARRHALTLATVPLPSPWSPYDTPRIDTNTAPAGNRGPRGEQGPGTGEWAPGTNIRSTGDRGPHEERGPGTGNRGPDSRDPLDRSGDQEAGAGDRDAGTGAHPAGDRGPHRAKGPVPGTRARGPENRDVVAGTGSREGKPGTGDREHLPGRQGNDSAGDRRPRVGDRVPGTSAHSAGDRGPHEERGPGTDAGDRGPNSRDRHGGTGDRTPAGGDRDSGTAHVAAGTATPAPGIGDRPLGTGDRASDVPRRRELSARARKSGDRRDRSPGPPSRRAPREPEQSVEHLVEQVRPHVPALLARDGNQAVTRVQLREILRREGLRGGRNDRLSLVLQRLRTEETTTKTRSTAR